MTKNDDKCVPALRFKGFNNDWAQRKLENLTNRVKSYSISHDAEVNQITGTKYIHYGDIHTGKVTRIQNESILPNIHDNNFVPLKNGDVIVADASEDYKGIADACVIDLPYQSYKIVSGLHTIAFRPNKELKPDFLYTYLHTSTFKHYGYRMGTGLKVFGISYKNLANMLIKLPDTKEQDKINKVLSLITYRIKLQQRKAKQLKLLKKAMLQMLYTKEYIPSLRFMEFSTKWNLVKLGDVTYRYDNLRQPVIASQRTHGKIPYYGANGIQDHVDGYTHKGKFLLIAEDGANDIHNYPVKYVDGKIWVNNHAHVIQSMPDKVDDIFLLNAIKIINMQPYLVGGSRAKLNADVMNKIPIKLPTLQEQKDIGSLAYHLDKLIKLCLSKNSQLQSAKQFLLQNMFI